MRRPYALAMFIIAIILLNACTLGASPAAPAASGDSTNTPGTGVTSAPSPTGGANSTSATASTSQPVTISFAATEDDRAIYEPLIRSFEAQNPDIHVQFVNFDSLLKQVAAPSGSVVSNDEESIQDIISAADTARLSATDESIQKGWVRDLTPLMNTDASFNQDDFYPGALQPVGEKNGIYTLPHTLFIPLLSYNKELWKAHDLPTPKPDMTWPDLLAAAQQLAQKNGDKVSVYGLIDWDIGITLLQREIVAAGIDPTHIDRLDQAEIAAAVDRIANLANSGAIYVLPDRPTNPGMFQQLISESQVGIWTSNMLLPGGSLPFEVGVMPFPEQSIGGDGYIMSNGTQHPEAAWRWLSFLSHKEVRQAGVSPNLIEQLPARKSTAEQSGYWTQLDSETKAVINAMLERAKSAPAHPPNFDIRADVLLRHALDSVIHEGRTTREALQTAQTTWEQQLAQQPPAPTETGNLIAVATPAPEPKPGATTITFGVPQLVADDARHIANVFNANNPDIFVQIKDTGPDNLPLSDLTGTADCFASHNLPDATTNGAVLDLQPLIDTDANFPIKEYPPTLLLPFSYQGHLYGLPYAVSLRVLNYNQSAFDAAGLAYPSATWTLDDFLNAAKTLTSGADPNKQYGFAGAQAQDLFFFLERFGASTTTGSGDTLKANFTDPKVIQAVRFYIDLLGNYSPHKHLEGYIRGETGNSAFQQISNGHVGMWFGFGTNFFGFRSGGYQGFTRAIAPPPLGNAAVTPDDFAANGLYISAKTQQQPTCWTWMKYLSGVFAGLGGGFPARLALAATDEYAKQAPVGAPEVTAAYQAAFDRTKSGDDTSASQGGTKIDYYWFYRAVDQALQGKDLERELADAQTTTEQYLACIKGGASSSNCATQVDPNYAG